MKVNFFRRSVAVLSLVAATFALRAAEPQSESSINLPSGKLLLTPVPGSPRQLSSFPVAVAASKDGRYLAIMNNGFGTVDSEFKQSISILDTPANTITDFPDDRLGQHSKQSFFVGLAFSSDGSQLFASVGSLTDPEGKHGGMGNGIAVYRFADGRIQPEKFIHIAASQLADSKKSVALADQDEDQDKDKQKTPSARDAIAYPAGMALVSSHGKDLLLVADNLSDDAVLLDLSSEEIIHRFDLSRHDVVPAEYPYAAIATRDGKTGYISLWNASSIAELDLESGKVRRFITLRKPSSEIATGSHPTALLLSPDEKWLYVTLSNQDAVALVDAHSGYVKTIISTKLPGQKFAGVYPDALAQSEDGARLFVANAGSDSVAVFDTSNLRRGSKALGFISTEWYPTALAVNKTQLFVASGKGRGTGPNNFPAPKTWPGRKHDYTYIPTLLHGSLALVPLDGLESQLPKWTNDVLRSNRMQGRTDSISFAVGHNPIRHVIYIVKENRSFDQILGDLGVGDGDPSLTMYGEAITPNEHKLARQFGVLDNFYTSGEVSGDGHVWSTAAITSDYTEKTWQIGYRSRERTYDYEGEVGGGYPLEEGIADVDEPGTGYLWGTLARRGFSYRHYGEFISSKWCNSHLTQQSPTQGTPLPGGESCAKTGIRKGEALPSYLGDPHGSSSPWPWEVPLLARNIPTKRELRRHFDPRFPDFNISFPDQLRVDEFLNEFNGFVEIRSKGRGDRMPRFSLLRLPNDHTGGTRPGFPTPSASVADNDLALGRVVEAVSHSPYWDDTVIFVLEDDAQDGPDHVEAHRSIAWVISKYAPLPPTSTRAFVDHSFYTTVNMLRTIESLVDLPPMNNNDARAALMAPLFSGLGSQPAFTADWRNRDNGLLYEVNTTASPGAQESALMDFSHADAADSEALNRILWRDRMKDRPYREAPRAGNLSQR